jgi:YD repeat-containing protein
MNRICEGLGPVDEFYGDAASGSLIDPARGNLIEQYTLPAGGPLDPVVVLSYNIAYRGNTDGYPDGWTSNFNRRIDNAASPDVDVISGSGMAYRYTNAAGSAYTAPDQAVNWLVDDGAGGWIETQPDGLKYYYNSSGKLTKIVNHLGKVWTMSYTGSQLTFIENPASKRTTFSYHAAFGKLEWILDAAGRRTTFTLGGNQLSTITSAELCQTQFTYDGSGRLQARISPAGNRTMFNSDYMCADGLEVAA